MEKSEEKKVAVALSYEPSEGAPKVVASGEGYVADKIIDRAQDSDVPLYKDSRLANTLSRLDLGEYIPEELYGVVAEILVFVDDMDQLKNKISLRRPF